MSGEQLSVRRLFDTIQEISGAYFTRVMIPTQIARFASLLTPIYYRMTKTEPRINPYSLEVLASNSDICHANARHELDYKPRSLCKTINDTVEWFANQHKWLVHQNN